MTAQNCVSISAKRQEYLKKTGFKKCLVGGCEGNSNPYAKGARGYCSTHYQRLRKTGSPSGGSTGHGEPMRWLLEHVVYKGDECLIWPYMRNNDGYGLIRDSGKNKHFMAHRVMCELASGKPNDTKLLTAHNCGNGHLGCVNPNHLRWDTPKGNMADKIIHGRNNRGMKHPKCQLTEDQVREIRISHPTENISQLARRFGVTRTSIRYILIRRNWSWLD